MPKTNQRYYSNVYGHRFWYYTGRNWEPKGYPYYGNGTVVYEFEDIAGHTETFELPQFHKHFELA